MKKAVLIIIISIILSNLVIAIESDKFGEMGKQKLMEKVCSSSEKGSAACQAYSALQDPTGQLLGQLGPQASTFFYGVKDPFGTGKTIVMDRIMSSMPPEVQSAAQFYYTFQGYLVNVNKYFGSDEAKRYEPCYDEDTKSTCINKDGEPYITTTYGITATSRVGIEDTRNEITGAVAKEPVELEKGKPSIYFLCDNKDGCKKVTADGFEASNLKEGDKVMFSDNPKTGETEFEILKGDINLIVNGRQLGPVRNGKFRIKDKVIEYAKFDSVKGGKYTFKYGNNKEYLFDVNKGGTVIYNPAEQKIGGKGLKQFNIGDMVFDGDFMINFGDKKLSTIKNIKFGENGIFIDKGSNIVATSPKEFNVCLSAHDTVNNVLNEIKGGCEGDNYFWLNKDPNNYLNIINTKGRIKYNVGQYTLVDTTDKNINKAARTTYMQTPNMDDVIMVTDGAAILEKDAIRSWIEDKGKCKTVTGKVVAFAIEILETEKKNCGLYISTARTGRPEVVTQRITVVDPYEEIMFQVGSTGTIVANNLKTGKAIIGLYQNYANPNENMYFSQSLNLFGQPLVTQEETSVALLKQRLNNLENLKKDLEHTKYDNLAIPYEYIGLKSYATFKEEAKDSLEDEINDLKGVIKFIEEGYTVDAAFEKMSIEKNSFLRNTMNSVKPDGTFDPNILLDVTKRRVEDSDGCFHTNLYKSLNCINEVKESLGIVRYNVYNEHNVLYDTKGKETLIGYLINKKGLSFEDAVKAAKNTVPALDRRSSFCVPLAGKCIDYIPAKNSKYGSLDEIHKYARKIEEDVKNDPLYKTLDDTEEKIGNSESWKEFGVFGLEFANTIDVVTLPTDVAAVFKLGRILKVKGVVKVENFLENYKTAAKGFENLKAAMNADLFKLLNKHDLVDVAKIDDIPDIAKVCA